MSDKEQQSSESEVIISDSELADLAGYDSEAEEFVEDVYSRLQGDYKWKLECANCGVLPPKMVHVMMVRILNEIVEDPVEAMDAVARITEDYKAGDFGAVCSVDHFIDNYPSGVCPTCGEDELSIEGKKKLHAILRPTWLRILDGVHSLTVGAGITAGALAMSWVLKEKFGFPWILDVLGKQ